LKVDLPLSVPGGALDAVADVARDAEAAGFDGVSYSEMSSDPLLHLTIAAGVTTRVELMTDIVVAFARSPMTLAVQGRAIQDYSKGRLVLGLGSQIKPHIERRFSMPWSAPAARMIEFISAMRAIWSSWETGDKLDFRGEFYTHTLMTPMFVPPSTYPAPKVFLAAVGELMTEASGAAADGMLIHPFSSERYLREVTLPAIARGKASAGVDPDRPFDIVSAALIVSGTTEEEMAASKVRVCEQLAFYGSTPAYRPVLELHGWGELGDELNRLSKTPEADKWQRMGRLIDDEVVDTLAIVGEPDRIGDLLAARYSGLITRCALSATGLTDPELRVRVARSVQAAS
jgi:probable F420-dependent oxidoreductase